MNTVVKDNLELLSAQPVQTALEAMLTSIANEAQALADEVQGLTDISADLLSQPSKRVDARTVQLLADADVETVANESFSDVASAMVDKTKDLCRRLMELIRRGVRYVVDWLADNKTVMATVIKRFKTIGDDLSSGKLKLKDSLTSDKLSSLLNSAITEPDLVKQFNLAVADLNTYFTGAFKVMGIKLKEEISATERANNRVKEIGELFNAAMKENYKGLFANVDKDKSGVSYSHVFFGGYQMVLTETEEGVKFAAKRATAPLKDPIDIKVPTAADIVNMGRAVDDKIMVCVTRFKTIVEDNSQELEKFISRIEKQDARDRVDSGDLKSLVRMFTDSMLATNVAVSRVYRNVALCALDLAEKSVQKA